jgi:hypothetical protein
MEESLSKSQELDQRLNSINNNLKIIGTLVAELVGKEVEK